MIDLEKVATQCAVPFADAEPVHWKGMVQRPTDFFGEQQVQAMLQDPTYLRRAGFFRDQKYMHPGEFPDVATPEGAMRLRREGVSLVLRGAQRRVGEPRFVCKELARIGNWPTVHAVAFETRQGIEALSTHWDPYAVLTVQTFGSKVWELYRPFFSDLDAAYKRFDGHPEKGHWFSDEEREQLVPENVTMRVTLEPGDLLYVPLGWTHRAIAPGDMSLHVSICPMSQYILNKYGNEDHELV